MPVLNHTIVAAHDHAGSATFMAELLGLPAPVLLGPFALVQASEATTLDFMETDGPVTSQHYAFLVTEAEFDEIFDRIRGRGLPYWADPTSTNPARSTPGTAAAASTSRIRTGTCSRSSPGRTAPAARRRTSPIHSSRRTARIGPLADELECRPADGQRATVRCRVPVAGEPVERRGDRRRLSAGPGEVVLVAERLGRGERRPVLPDESPAGLGRALLRPLLERRPAGEETPEPVTDREVSLGGHVPEIVGDAAAADGHVATGDAATRPAHCFPPGMR